MKTLNKRKTVFLVSMFFVAFIVVVAILWTPQVTQEVYPDDKELLHTWDSDDVMQANDCSIATDGTVSIDGNDAFLVFPEIKKSGKLVEIYFKEPLKKDAEIEIYMNSFWGFSEGRRTEYQCEKGDTFAAIILDVDEYKQLRLDLDVPYQLDRVEVYQIRVVTENATSNQFWLLWALVIGLIFAIAMYFVDAKVGISDYIVEKTKWLWTKFREKFWCIVGMGIVSVIGSIILTGIPNLLLFKLYQFVVCTFVIFTLLCSIACLWNYRKGLIQNFEKVFLSILLLVGVTIIVTTPIGHSAWDTNVHYKIALETSYWGDAKLTKADLMVIDVDPYAMVTVDSGNNFRNAEMLTINHQEIVKSYQAGVSLSHIPSAIFIALGRLIGLPFAFTFMLGKLPNLLIYAFLCYAGLKKLKSGKLLFSVIALIPTSVYLACSYSYDCWVTGFSLMGMAYFIGALQDRENTISTKDTIIMSAAMGIACYPKLIYFPIMLVPFIMPKKKMKKPKKYYMICFFALAVMVLSFMITAFTQVTGTGDQRGDGHISPMQQVMFIFTHIFEYAFILLKFLFTDYLTIGNMENYISNFVYLGMGVTTVITIVLAILTFLYDKDAPYSKEVQTGWRTRGYTTLMYFGGSALVATALYVAFTAVGSKTIEGCQPRYIIPWLYPLLSAWSINGIKPRIKKSYLYWIVTIGCFGVLFYNIWAIFVPTVIPVRLFV